MKIINIHSIEILDSRGFPTVEVKIELENNVFGFGISPSGASTGSAEAFELRDNDKNRFKGKGVLTAVSNVNNLIKKEIIGKEFNSQKDFDLFLINLDGTENKRRLGANALLACSLAFSDASAEFYKLDYVDYIQNIFESLGGVVQNRKMPIPLVNVLNGGKHADNLLNVQEFMIVPISDSFLDIIEIGGNVFHNLKSILKNAGHSINVGDEGGFAPNINSTKEALDLISEAVLRSGYKIGKDVSLALDVAASEFYNHETSKYKIEYSLHELDKWQMIDFYKNLIKDYNIFSLEDPFYEKDIEGFKDLFKEVGEKIQIVGDDLFTTNKNIISSLIEPQVANAVLIKPNQIGTLFETLETILYTKSLGYQAVMSHRSGETEDVKIADIALGTGIMQVKFGSFSRTDRTLKYNHLIRYSSYNNLDSTFFRDLKARYTFDK